MRRIFVNGKFDDYPKQIINNEGIKYYIKPHKELMVTFGDYDRQKLFSHITSNYSSIIPRKKFLYEDEIVLWDLVFKSDEFENITICDSEKGIIKELERGEDIFEYTNKSIISSCLCFNLNNETVRIRQNREGIQLESKNKKALKQAIRKVEDIVI